MTKKVMRMILQVELWGVPQIFAQTIASDLECEQKHIVQCRSEGDKEATCALETVSSSPEVAGDTGDTNKYLCTGELEPIKTEAECKKAACLLGDSYAYVSKVPAFETANLQKHFPGDCFARDNREEYDKVTVTHVFWNPNSVHATEGTPHRPQICNKPSSVQAPACRCSPNFVLSCDKSRCTPLCSKTEHGDADALCADHRGKTCTPKVFQKGVNDANDDAQGLCPIKCEGDAYECGERGQCHDGYCIEQCPEGYIRIGKQLGEFIRLEDLPEERNKCAKECTESPDDDRKCLSFEWDSNHKKKCTLNYEKKYNPYRDSKRVSIRSVCSKPDQEDFYYNDYDYDNDNDGQEEDNIHHEILVVSISDQNQSKCTDNWGRGYCKFVERLDWEEHFCRTAGWEEYQINCKRSCKLCPDQVPASL